MDHTFVRALDLNIAACQTEHLELGINQRWDDDKAVRRRDGFETRECAHAADSTFKSA